MGAWRSGPYARGRPRWRRRNAWARCRCGEFLAALLGWGARAVGLSGKARPTLAADTRVCPRGPFLRSGRQPLEDINRGHWRSTLLQADLAMRGTSLTWLE